MSWSSWSSFSSFSSLSGSGSESGAANATGTNAAASTSRPAGGTGYQLTAGLRTAAEQGDLDERRELDRILDTGRGALGLRAGTPRAAAPDSRTTVRPLPKSDARIRRASIAGSVGGPSLRAAAATGDDRGGDGGDGTRATVRGKRSTRRLSLVDNAKMDPVFAAGVAKARASQKKRIQALLAAREKETEERLKNERRKRRQRHRRGTHARGDEEPTEAELEAARLAGVVWKGKTKKKKKKKKRGSKRKTKNKHRRRSKVKRKSTEELSTVDEGTDKDKDEDNTGAVSSDEADSDREVQHQPRRRNTRGRRRESQERLVSMMQIEKLRRQKEAEAEAARAEAETEADAPSAEAEAASSGHTARPRLSRARSGTLKASDLGTVRKAAARHEAQQQEEMVASVK